MPELKPCPFCGGEPTIRKIGGMSDHPGITVIACGCGCSLVSENCERTIERWNNRPETAAARDVLAERARQISAEGWTPEHDDQHEGCELGCAASYYAIQASDAPWSDRAPDYWPWADEWWKPSTPRHDLVKAGALILAEIERLDRAAEKGGK